MNNSLPLPCFPYPCFRKKTIRNWEIYIQKRRLLDVLFLAYRNFANFDRSQKQSNSRCLRGMFISLLHLCQSKVYLSCYTHIGVGFCVARSDCDGHAKASIRGTGNRYRFPRFFFIYRYCIIFFIHKNHPVRESAEGHRLTRQAASTQCGFQSSIY